MNSSVRASHKTTKTSRNLLQCGCIWMLISGAYGIWEASRALAIHTCQDFIGFSRLPGHQRIRCISRNPVTFKHSQKIHQTSIGILCIPRIPRTPLNDENVDVFLECHIFLEIRGRARNSLSSWKFEEFLNNNNKYHGSNDRGCLWKYGCPHTHGSLIR